MSRFSFSLFFLSLVSTLFAFLTLTGCGGGGGSDGDSNSAPTILTLTASASTVTPGSTVILTGYANDADGDTLEYIWSSTVGSLATSNPNNPVLTIPDSTCSAIQVTLQVSDGKLTAVKSITLNVNGGSDCGSSSSTNSGDNTSNSNSSSNTGGDSDSSSDNSSGTSGDNTSNSNSSSNTGGDSDSSSDSSSDDDDSSSSSSSSTAISQYLNPGYFESVSEADINSTKVSDINTVRGGLENEPISVDNNGSIMKNGVNVGGSTTVTDGDRIQILLTTGEDYSTEYTTTLSIAEFTTTFSVSTLFKRDTEPRDFDLGDDVDEAELSTTYETETITVEGITVTTPATLSNGIAYVNGSVITSSNFNVENGDDVQILMASSDNYEETVTTKLTIGTKSDTFSITTKANELQILIEDQYFAKNEEVDIDVADYLVSFYADDLLTCSFSGSMPTGLTYDESTCTFSGTTSSLTETRTITIATTSQYGLSEEKAIVLYVDDFESLVQQTGEEDIIRTGDDAYYANQGLGVELDYTTMSGYVRDNNTKLYWQDTEVVQSDIEEALAYCSELSLGGMKSWRLPTQAELETINNTTVEFDYYREGNYWSSTPFAGNTTQYWYIDTTPGEESYHMDMTIENYVRCVRSGS